MSSQSGSIDLPSSTAGDVIRKVAQAAPVPWPIRVTLVGSPPNSATFSCSQWSATLCAVDKRSGEKNGINRAEGIGEKEKKRNVNVRINVTPNGTTWFTQRWIDIINTGKRINHSIFVCHHRVVSYQLSDPSGRGWRWNANTDHCGDSEILKKI